MPEAVFMFADTLLVFDHVTHKIKVVSQVRLDGDIEKAYQEATRKIDELVERLNQPLPVSKPIATAAVSTGAYTSNFSKEEFEESVRKIKQYINAGEVIQVVLSQRLARPTDVPPRLKSTGPCAPSIPRLICIIWISRISRLSALRRKSWSEWRMARS